MPLELPRPGQKTEAWKGMMRGAAARRRAPRAAPSLSSPPAEPSPILMMAERARGQEIGAGSCGSGDSAASRRALGGRRRRRGAARGDGAALLTPRRLSWGQDAGNRADQRAGRARTGQGWRLRAPPSNRKRRPSLQRTAGRLGLGGGPAGQENKAPDAERPGRHRKRTARPGDPRPPAARRRPCPRPRARRGK